MRNQIYLIVLIFFLTGCATAPIYMPPVIERPSVPGFYHKVEKGQTLWRIAKFYNVNMDDVVRLNRIPNATQITTGQLLFIPNATAVKPSQVPLMKETFDISDFMWPAKGKVVFFYGSKKDGVSNKGIDIALNKNADIAASRAGKVVFCDTKLKGYGQMVIIDHLDGFSTLYAYNSAVYVKQGQEVKRGQVIARSGSPPGSPCGRLHFEIRKGAKPQNPFYYLP
jgi:lipoprotein NlpD